MAEKKLTFEQAMAVWRRLSPGWSGETAPLEDALALFEEGTSLMKKCSTMLDKAEQKVIKLTAAPDGTPVEQPMDQSV